MRTRLAAALLLALLTACAPETAPSREGQGRDTAPPVTTAAGVRIEGAELREGLPGVDNGMLYLTLTNTGERAVTLLGARTPLAREVVPMRDHGAGAPHGHGEPLNPTLAPGETRVFEPGGDHLMLMGLTRSPQVGEAAPVTLDFAPGGEVTLNVPVNPY